MDNKKKEQLAGMVLAPYIQKATALRGKRRFVGGNQFRHALSTMAILLDYLLIDPVMLKAAIIHDLFEDAGNLTSPDEIKGIDSDGPDVYKLVMELTRICEKEYKEPKDEYLKRILTTGSTRAKQIKCADRISNLTDLHTDIFNKNFVKRYLKETKVWIFPMAQEVNQDMLFELQDIVHRREETLTFLSNFWSSKKHS
jgi:(p)ppGpp synthase/HD superfamily hydrolase